ncbi:bifunctional folylpolyglutamate synthase/dihydrofolate synthase [bacterium]|nr:bifunctional folylpolyglutamate synthase/dihydrofolate synthase [bacterium]
MMTKSFEATLKYLYDLQFFGMKLGLDNTRSLLEYLENPQHSFPVIHVAGTNGKGSTCAMLDAIFHAAGYKTGLYTSPHLFHFSERIRINGACISEADIVRLTNKMRTKIDELKCTFFEATTAMAFDYFKENGIEIGIIETGLGGRLDATNVVDPLLSLITNIDLEHTEHLGKTMESIAVEKAGIIKPYRPCLVGFVDDNVKRVFDDKARSVNSTAFYLGNITTFSNVQLEIDRSQIDLNVNIHDGNYFFENLNVNLTGKHQLTNAAMAVSSAVIQKQFPVSEDAIRLGLENVIWPARLEVIRKDPWIIADAAHNPAGMMVLAEAVESVCKPHFNKLFLIIGMLADKDYAEAVRIIAPHFTDIYTVTPRNEGALKAEDFAESIRQFYTQVPASESFENAFLDIQSKMNSNDLLVITGSHFLLSELKHIRMTS